MVIATTALTRDIATNAIVTAIIGDVKMTPIIRKCSNCLNAYNPPDDCRPHCWNKDFQAQFSDICCTVRPDETCGAWQRRRAAQAPLKWDNPIQLSLIDELLTL